MGGHEKKLICLGIEWLKIIENQWHRGPEQNTEFKHKQKGNKTDNKQNINRILPTQKTVC